MPLLRTHRLVRCLSLAAIVLTVGYLPNGASGQVSSDASIESAVEHYVEARLIEEMIEPAVQVRDYLIKSVAEDRSWDQIFRDLMLAEQGAEPSTGASAFVRARLNDVDKMTNEVSVRFFGVNISCAQCHDHPLVSDWNQVRTAVRHYCRK